jgi:hypothetical protein
MQILELVLSLLARLLRDLGALNLVVNLVLAGSSVSAVHWQKIAVQQTHHQAGLTDAVFGEPRLLRDLAIVVRERPGTRRENPIA